jgi:hypothetical protein
LLGLRQAVEVLPNSGSKLQSYQIAIAFSFPKPLKERQEITIKQLLKTLD